jgi:alpha-D-xyloside xylohydrolase
MPSLPAKGKRWAEPAAHCNSPGGHTPGGPNEIWSFGGDNGTVYPILKGIIALRESIRPYISELAMNASVEGSPPMRPLFYDFPDDTAAAHIEDEFMFGPKYLVAPVLTMGARNRTVYFPGDPKSVVWRHHYTNASYIAGSSHIVPAPIDQFPLFTRETRK